MLQSSYSVPPEGYKTNVFLSAYNARVVCCYYALALSCGYWRRGLNILFPHDLIFKPGYATKYKLLFALLLSTDHDDEHDHVDGMRQRLWTVATNWPIVHPPSNTWPWRTMMEWCWNGKTLIRSPELSGDPAVRLISSKAVGIGEEHYECDFTKYLCSYFEGIFNMP
jgi:hypothetical protein